MEWHFLAVNPFPNISAISDQPLPISLRPINFLFSHPVHLWWGVCLLGLFGRNIFGVVNSFGPVYFSISKARSSSFSAFMNSRPYALSRFSFRQIARANSRLFYLVHDPSNKRSCSLWLCKWWSRWIAFLLPCFFRSRVMVRERELFKLCKARSCVLRLKLLYIM